MVKWSCEQQNYNNPNSIKIKCLINLNMKAKVCFTLAWFLRKKKPDPNKNNHKITKKAIEKRWQTDESNACTENWKKF